MKVETFGLLLCWKENKVPNALAAALSRSNFDLQKECEQTTIVVNRISLVDYLSSISGRGKCTVNILVPLNH